MFVIIRWFDSVVWSLSQGGLNHMCTVHTSWQSLTPGYVVGR